MSVPAPRVPAPRVPALSVVMSVYNGGPYLHEAVDSILEQTYRDFELVAIDDGSTDGSGEVLDAFAARDARVRVLHQENRGLIASLNRGLRESRGALVARMDADDRSLPDRFERQVRFLEAHPEVGIVGGIARYVGADGEDLGGHWPSWSPAALNGWRTLFETVLCHPTVLLRRDVLERVGDYHAEALHAEDYELWTRALFATQIANVPEVVLERRKWEGTIGALHAERQEQSVIAAMQAAHARLVGRPVAEPVVARLRALATGRSGARPVADDRTAARHLVALYRAYTARPGGASKEVADHVLRLLLALRQGAGPRRLVPVAEILRVAPGASLRHLGRRVQQRLRPRRRQGPLRVAPYPAHSANPYLDLFYGALDPEGVEVEPGFQFSVRWLHGARHALDAVHFHWPERLWDGRHEPPLRALVKLRAFLAAARAYGVRIVWTVHNLDSHEALGGVDRRARALLARHTDLAIVHSTAAAHAYRARYRPAGEVRVMPHGSYLGHYPAPRPAAAVRHELGLDPERPVVACVGRLRDYKGLDEACAAAAVLGRDAQLLVAGVAHPGFDVDALERRMARLPGAVLLQSDLTDQEFADVVAASDLVLLPYRQITGSGALLAAWSLERAVVASDLPYFRELIPPGSEAGWLARADDPDALATAVREALATPGAARAAAARGEAERYAWPRCAPPVADALRALVGRGAS